MKRTPLYEDHLAAGGKMVDFAGWQLPVQYHSIVAEHRAVRESAGLFDVSHMGELQLSGTDALACIRELFANDASLLRPGRAQYSLIPNESGGVVDDIIVYCLAPDRFLVCVNAANAEKDLAWIRSRVHGDCYVEDLSAATALLALQGPAAAGVLGQLAPDCASIERFACRRMPIAGVQAWVARTGYTGEDGFELFVAADQACALWRALLEAGGGRVQPAGLGARDTLRLEAALPLYGHELEEDVSPYEAGLDWVVKLNRPQLTGYAALRRARDDGAGRRLVGLEIDQGIARAGFPVVASGGKIGIVTSGSYGPWLRRAIALALVACDSDDTDVAVEVRGKQRSARIVDLPFYSHGDPAK